MQAERFITTDSDRVMLTAEDFCRLVRGGVVRKIIAGKTIFGTIKATHIALALQDMGYNQMHMLIEEAEGLR